MSTTSSPTSSLPVSTASRAMTPPWQPLRLEDAWKALPFADADELPLSDATDDETTKCTSSEAVPVDKIEKRVRFGADMVAEFSVQVPDVAAEEKDWLQSAPMDVDEPAREIRVGTKPGTALDEKASFSTEVAALTSKPPHHTTAFGAPNKPTSKSKPKKKKTRPVSLSNPPLLDYMCRCDDCAARREEFLQTIGRRTVRWDEWPWCMVGDGYGTWYEEEVTDSEGEEEE